MSFVEELKRRNVLRIAAAYIAVSWLLIQVIETLFPIFGISDATIRIIVIILAIGFIPAVIIAWAFELTPEGLQRDSNVPAESRQSGDNKKLDRLIAAALALAVAYFAVDKFVFDPARDKEREQEIAEAARAEGEAAALGRDNDGPPMVAVLPFVTTGPGADSEFFAAGIHEDLLTQLAQLPSLRVISRTSVMEYKDVERNLREIGEELGADAILEGRVQSSGNQIRINAQLIDARTDEHLWAETFNGDLTPSSIFELQSEIANAITEAMDITLGESDIASTMSLPTSNMAAYRLYHEALALVDENFDLVESEEYRDKLRQANQLDPNYTRPLAQLVGSLSLEGFGGKNPEAVAQAEESLAQIARVAPNSADHLIAQAFYTYYVVQDYELAQATATRAIDMSPSDARLLEMRAWIERRLGDYDALIESLRRARAVDPRNPRFSGTLINNLAIAGRYDEAAAEIEALGGVYQFPALLGAMLEARNHGDLSRVGDRFIEISKEFGDQAFPSNIWDGYVMKRDFAAAAAYVESEPGPFEARDSRRYGIMQSNSIRMWTYRLLGDEEKLTAAIEAAQADFDEHFSSDEAHHIGEEILGQALLASMRGDQETTERLVRQWRREVATDNAARIGSWGFTCELLGIVGMAEAAVDCLRTGLSGPSRMAPFIDPYLPYYDGIRDDPVFVEFVAGLEDESGSR